VYVEDADTTINKALEKGARLVMPIEDHFYGDRSGRIEDPFGYIWIVSTHVRDVSEEEMKKIMEGLMPAD
jgi:PhnB protein